ncbi:hypothetical protein G6F40_017286 [Rhizopus arrhizus]|nr:hypothetical protein G6F40_017286 [Rhizopus arrhizus]
MDNRGPETHQIVAGNLKVAESLQKVLVNTGLAAEFDAKFLSAHSCGSWRRHLRGAVFVCALGDSFPRPRRGVTFFARKESNQRNAPPAASRRYAPVPCASR